MKIAFRTKDEANMEQERDFLALSGSERCYRFIELIQHGKRLPTKAKKLDKNSFKVKIKTND